MFIEELNNYPWEETKERIYSKTAGDVERVSLEQTAPVVK